MIRVLPLLIAVAASLPAQYALSAMAGYIHHAEGEVWLGDRAITPRPQDFQHVLEGRRLRVGQGRAEILLVPGSFVRVGSDSEIEMVESGLASARIRLISGSMVVDLQALYEKDSIGIEIGDSQFRFRKTGLYRFDAGEAGVSTLRVLDGRARLIEASGKELDVKSGQECRLDQGFSEKIAETVADPLDTWNHERHDELAVLSEDLRTERWDGMSQAERDLLRMLLYRPGAPPVSNRPAGQPSPRATRSSK